MNSRLPLFLAFVLLLQKSVGAAESGAGSSSAPQYTHEECIRIALAVGKAVLTTKLDFGNSSKPGEFIKILKQKLWTPSELIRSLLNTYSVFTSSQLMDPKFSEEDLKIYNQLILERVTASTQKSMPANSAEAVSRLLPIAVDALIDLAIKNYDLWKETPIKSAEAKELFRKRADEAFIYAWRIVEYAKLILSDLKEDAKIRSSSLTENVSEKLFLSLPKLFELRGTATEQIAIEFEGRYTLAHRILPDENSVLGRVARVFNNESLPRKVDLVVLKGFRSRTGTYQTSDGREAITLPHSLSNYPQVDFKTLVREIKILFNVSLPSSERKDSLYVGTVSLNGERHHLMQALIFDSSRKNYSAVYSDDFTGVSLTEKIIDTLNATMLVFREMQGQEKGLVLWQKNLQRMVSEISMARARGELPRITRFRNRGDLNEITQGLDIGSSKDSIRLDLLKKMAEDSDFSGRLTFTDPQQNSEYDSAPATDDYMSVLKRITDPFFGTEKKWEGALTADEVDDVLALLIFAKRRTEVLLASITTARIKYERLRDEAAFQLVSPDGPSKTPIVAALADLDSTDMHRVTLRKTKPKTSDDEFALEKIPADKISVGANLLGVDKIALQKSVDAKDGDKKLSGILGRAGEFLVSQDAYRAGLEDRNRGMDQVGYDVGFVRGDQEIPVEVKAFLVGEKEDLRNLKLTRNEIDFALRPENRDKMIFAFVFIKADGSSKIVYCRKPNLGALGAEDERSFRISRFIQSAEILSLQEVADLLPAVASTPALAVEVKKPSAPVKVLTAEQRRQRQKLMGSVQGAVPKAEQ